jgi:hypothetical protein
LALLLLLLLLLLFSVLLVQNIEDVDEILRAVKRHRWDSRPARSTLLVLFQHMHG